MLCAEQPVGSVRSARLGAIVARLVGSGQAWVSATPQEGPELVRPGAMRGETLDDVMNLIRRLEAKRNQKS